MPRPKKTPSQLESTREQILDTALAILQESGPEAITSRAIAERLGVAHMSLYTYFENQAAILRALREREMSRWSAQQQVFAQRAQTEAIPQVVDDLLGFFIAFAREKPNLYRMAWVMPEATGEVGKKSSADADDRRSVGLFAQIGDEHGDFAPREPFLAASTVLAMVNTPFTLFHSGKLVDPLLRDRMVAEMLSAVMLYLKREPVSSNGIP